MTAMPTWDQFMLPMLQVMQGGQIRSLRELKTQVAAVAATPQQQAELLPSGEPKTENRIGWAASYLTRVGALERPVRGQYRITDLGRELIVTHPNGISEKQIRSHAKPGDEWWVAKGAQTTAPEVDAAEDASAAIDPVEQIETGLARIQSDVAADLLGRLHGKEPAFFEQAVLDLIMGMGFGGADGKATRTQLSNDGGIDGVVDQDALGLSRIYVQAKRYAPESAVGRPEVQAFVGALHGAQANQGVFITTGRFSSGARDYADTVPTRVVLIDGTRLTSLMIRYGVGVQVKRTVHIVEVDEDFFE